MASPPVLFVYGTLLRADRQHAVTRKRFPQRPAVLHGYRRISPPGGYPYIVACPGDHVRGAVLFQVDAASLAKLDRYENEGTLYFRRPVEVVCDGNRICCEAYVGNALARPSKEPVRE